jgi:hypothetical protein
MPAPKVYGTLIRKRRTGTDRRRRLIRGSSADDQFATSYGVKSDWQQAIERLTQME